MQEQRIRKCFAIVYAVFQIINHAIEVRKINKVESSEIQSTSNASSDNTELHILILCMGIVTAICLHLGVPFIYYFATCYPVFVLTLISLIVYSKAAKQAKEWDGEDEDVIDGIEDALNIPMTLSSVMLIFNFF